MIKSPRIFVVEDNEDFALFVTMILRTGLDAQVTSYNDGLRGLEGCLSGSPELVILDLDLPSLRGEEICRLLRSSPLHRKIPIIVCSSMPDPEKREMELLQIGADIYLPKPVESEDLVNAVQRLLEARTADSDEEPLGGNTPSPSTSRNGTPVPPAVEGHEMGQPFINQDFEGYCIIEMIGSGGMGTVYRAINSRLNRAVALKVMLSRLAGISRLAERFRREAHIMGQLNHPNIVRIYDIGETEYTLYIVMEYVDGSSLYERMQRGRMLWEDTCSTIGQMFDAMVYLHDSGILHRDIKPSNVLLSSEGVVKICDFGVSRQGTALEKHEFTKAGTLIGTPQYMAPELLAGAPADKLTDQFALARTILHFLEGPIMSFPPKPLHDIRPDLPLPLSRALARCMDLHPSMRFPTMALAREAVMKACAIHEGA